MPMTSFGLADEKLKADFLSGRLNIDCVEITLTQKGAQPPRAFSCQGSIKVDTERGAQARLVVVRDSGQPYDAFASLREGLRAQSGQLFPETSYYKLELRDVFGNLWTNPSVMLGIEETKAADILTFKCSYIEMEGASSRKGTLAHFVFTEDLEFPLNTSLHSSEWHRDGRRSAIKMDVSEGEVEGMKVSYCARPSASPPLFELSATSTDIVPEVHFHAKLLEAVRFCCAKMARPVMEEIIRDGKRTVVLSRAQPFNHGMVMPPVRRENHASFYALMQSYYRYAADAEPSEDFSALSQTMAGLFTLKGVWIETVALLVSVSCESILNKEFKDIGKPSSGFLGMVDALVAAVKKLNLDSGLIQRAVSAVGVMKNSRAKDKMFLLAKAGAIDEAEIKSWGSLRNAAAHGSLEIDTAKLQGFIDDVNRVIVLIYKLAFLRIDFEGSYADYGAKGWPDKTFSASAVRAKLDPPQ